MNKNDLVASVAEISGLTKADALRAVDGVIQSITKSLKESQDLLALELLQLPIVQLARGVIHAQVKKFKFVPQSCQSFVRAKD